MGTVFAYWYTKSNKIRPALLLLAFTVFFSILFCASVAFGAVDVSLAWDPVIHPDLAGYKMFYRETSKSYDYLDPVWTGTETTCTVFELAENTSYCFLVRAFDTFGNESDDSNEVCWPPPSDSNTPPVLGTIGSKSVDEGNSLTFTVTASDPDGDGLTLSASNVPTGASFDPSSQVFSWTPDYGDAGIYTVTFSVTDQGSPSESDSETVTITVGNVNRPPVLSTIGSKSVDEGVLFSFTVTGSDPDGDGLTFSASNAPTGASFNPSTRVFSWTPSFAAAGSYDVTFTVIDDGSPAESDSETVTITVGNVNRPPVLGTIGSKSVDEGELLSFTISASDPDGDTLTYSTGNLPFGAHFNSGTQTFSWTPAIGDAGDYNVQFTVIDNGSPPESDFEIVAVTVVDASVGNLAPDQPVIISPYSGETESDLLLTVETDSFSDPDGDVHKETQWQIVKAADSSVVLEIMSKEHLTELPVPHAVLDRKTTYHVSVQFVDAHSEPSSWSDPVEFTTHNGVIDYDSDGIPDDSEVDDSVDLNNDGTPDNDQPNVIKSAHSAVAGKKPLGVNKISASIDSIELLEPIHPSEILDKKNKPKKFLFGLAAYRLKLNQIGATTQVKVYYGEDVSDANHYYLYDTVNGWQDYTQYTTFNPDGRSVTVELKDGGHGDSDGVANGIIVDPGGVVGASADGLDPGVGGGCFIASATLGSSMEPNLKLHAASYLARIFHVLLSRDHETGNPLVADAAFGAVRD
jgi:hypothetical protein